MDERRKIEEEIQKLNKIAFENGISIVIENPHHEDKVTEVMLKIFRKLLQINNELFEKQIKELKYIAYLKKEKRYVNVDAINFLTQTIMYEGHDEITGYPDAEFEKLENVILYKESSDG